MWYYPLLSRDVGSMSPYQKTLFLFTKKNKNKNKNKNTRHTKLQDRNILTQFTQILFE